MDLVLDGQGPLNAQIVRAMKAAIVSGRLATGTRVPSTRDLADSLAVSRTTIVSAYDQLRTEGYLDGVVGSGSFVRMPHQIAAMKSPRAERFIAPPSRYAGRAREARSGDALPFRRIENCRYIFQSGMTLVNPALSTAWSREVARAALYAIPDYPSPQGVGALREAVCNYLARRRGVLAAPDDILIVGGSQQALAIVARVLVDEGAPVVVEEPQYYGTRQALQAHGASLIGAPVDLDGICTDALPADGARLVCVTPSHQFPSGGILSQARRQALLDYVERHDSWIYEDDYDGEFRYAMRPLAALRSQDREGRVLYVGTFSKTLFPSLRLAYIVMPPALRQDLINAKFLLDFGCNTIDQVALASFMKAGAFDRHLRVAAKALRDRREALVQSLEAIDRGRLAYFDSRAGAHLLVWLKDVAAKEGAAFQRYLHEQGVGMHLIDPCYLVPPDGAGILMTYGALSVKEIRAAMSIFGKCLDARYDMMRSNAV
ncbi:transcriptional regulator [Lysobacter helvus]|uniref:Transcriptional regulator n=2 Tax=Lysobacteraceae TaxID=32033 RepID=A0ABM7Q700_9GAMM|nr:MULTISPECIES: PLP-dependent aminotransferase family protein [Lysobacter]BCT93180.1 transcriptional regulator [Lysobacter caseinilyticus]BCT96332.1 transcriptional regulator [Lysobacter helvus]